MSEREWYYVKNGVRDDVSGTAPPPPHSIYHNFNSLSFLFITAKTTILTLTTTYNFKYWIITTAIC